MKKLICAAALIFCYQTNAHAAESPLTTDGIIALLTGKTISGVHYGKRTIQYFSKSGLTLWIGQGDELPSEGSWKAENDQYCSKFGSDWGCLTIAYDEAQDIHYFLGDEFRAPFVVADGFSLDF